MQRPKSPTPEQIESFTKFSKSWGTQSDEFTFWLPPSQIEGTIPLELRGTFFRNGPGNHEVFGVPLVHPIDGDGMVCAVTFVDGKVNFKNRYIRTAHREKEREEQKFLFPGQMGTRTAATKGKPYRNPAHTNVWEWGGVLVTSHEYALPHILDPATLETVGASLLSGALKSVRTLGAHPRFDMHQNRLVTESFKPTLPGGRPSTLFFAEFDRAWSCKHSITFNIEGMNYAHDYLLFKDFYIAHMTPFVTVSKENMRAIMEGKSSPGEQMKYNPQLPSRMYILPRYDGKIPIRFVDVMPCHIYHFGRALHDPLTDTVTFDACCLPKEFNMNWQKKFFLSNVVDAPGLMYNFAIDLKTMKVKEEQADRAACEFPTVNPFRHIGNVTQPPRYTYTMACDSGLTVPFQDVVKIDAICGSSGRQTWHSEGVVGEPFFMPRLGAASAFFGAEDDGWLIVQEYDPDSHTTNFVILDAQNVGKGPVCRIKLGIFIPNPFHGTWSPYVFVQPPRPKL
jgi:all-trans-8'-apo-beta-carotenal 15,15'-oxygenase